MGVGMILPLGMARLLLPLVLLLPCIQGTPSHPEEQLLQATDNSTRTSSTSDTTPTATNSSSARNHTTDHTTESTKDGLVHPRANDSASSTFAHPGELQLTQDNLLSTLANLGKEWRVTLQFKPTEYITGTAINDWTSLIHLTIGRNKAQHGDRTPAIFLHKDLGFCIASSVNDDDDFYQKLPPIGNWTMIEICQREEDGEFTFYVSMEAKEVYSVKNNKPREFYDVKVYASNPWYTAQPGSIRNLTVETKLEDCVENMFWEDGTCITSCREECKANTKDPNLVYVFACAGALLLLLILALLIFFFRKRAQPGNEEIEPAQPDSPYYDQGDYDDMEDQAAGTNTTTPKRNEEKREKKVADYEGTYLEQ